MGEAILGMQSSYSILLLHRHIWTYLCVAEAASCAKEGRHQPLPIWQGFRLWKSTCPHFAEYGPNFEVRQSLVQHLLPFVCLRDPLADAAIRH